MRWRSTLVGLAIVALILACLALVIAAANEIDLLHAATPGGATRLNLWITIVAAAIGIALFAVFVIVGVDDAMEGRELSVFYWPLVATKGALATLLTVVAITSVDLLLHDYMLRWTFMMDPEVRLVVSLLYLALVFTLAWQVAVVVLGRIRD